MRHGRIGEVDEDPLAELHAISGLVGQDPLGDEALVADEAAEEGPRGVEGEGHVEAYADA